MPTHTQQLAQKCALKACACHRANLFIAILTILIAPVTLAPTTSAGQPSERISPTMSLQDAGVSSDPLFLPPVNYHVPFGGAGAVAAADVNGDGRPDVLVAADCFTVLGCHSDVSVVLGNGDGTLQPAVSYDSGGTVLPLWP